MKEEKYIRTNIFSHFTGKVFFRWWKFSNTKALNGKQQHQQQQQPESFSLSTTLDSSSSVSWSRDCVLFLSSLFCCMFSSHQTFSYSRLLHLLNVRERHSNIVSYCFVVLFHIQLWAFYATVFSSIAIVLQLQFWDWKETTRTKWMMF